MRVAAVALETLVFAGCGLSLQQLPKPGGVSGPSYTLHAVFANVLNLPIQARVLIGSDQVGDVSDIGTKDFKADLALTIRAGIHIPRGTTAQILFVDPLGDEFIQLHPPAGKGSGPYLANGDTLGESETDSAPSIPDTLAALGTLLNGGGLNQLQTIITQLNDALGGHQSQIRTILGDLAYTVTTLNDNKASVDNALSGLAALSVQLGKGDAAIANGIDTIGPAVAVLNSENSDFNQLLTSTTQLADVASNIVDTSSSNIVGTIRQFGQVINQMVAVEGQLGPTLADPDPFEREHQAHPRPAATCSSPSTAPPSWTPSPSSAPTWPAAGQRRAAPRLETAAIQGLLGAGLP